jgi:hypothetical protein
MFQESNDDDEFYLSANVFNLSVALIENLPAADCRRSRLHGIKI